MVSVGAQILAEVADTPGSNDMPTRLQFFTPADGASTSTERLRITQDGHLVIGGDSNNTFAGLQRLDIFNTSTADNYHGSLIRLITKNAAGNSTASYDMVKYKEGTVSHNNNESGGSINFYAGGATRLQVLSTGNINVNDGDGVITITATEDGSHVKLDGATVAGSIVTGASGYNLQLNSGFADTSTYSNAVTFQNTSAPMKVFHQQP